MRKERRKEGGKNKMIEEGEKEGGSGVEAQTCMSWSGKELSPSSATDSWFWITAELTGFFDISTL